MGRCVVKISIVNKIVVVAAYEIRKSCFGVSGVLVGSKHFTMGSQPIQTWVRFFNIKQNLSSAKEDYENFASLTWNKPFRFAHAYY